MQRFILTFYIVRNTNTNFMAFKFKIFCLHSFYGSFWYIVRNAYVKGMRNCNWRQMSCNNMSVMNIRKKMKKHKKKKKKISRVRNYTHAMCQWRKETPKIVPLEIMFKAISRGLYSFIFIFCVR